MASTARPHTVPKGVCTATSAMGHALPTPSTNLVNRLRELFGRLAMPQAAEATWRDLLTEQERAKLGSNLKETVNKYGWNAGKLYSMAKGISPGAGVLEVARSQGMVTPAEYKSLRRELDACEGRHVGKRQQPYDANEELLLHEIEQAAVNCDLVVVAGDTVRGVYWGGMLMNVTWMDNHTSWDFVLKLAKACERGVVLDAQNIKDDATGGNVSNWKHNLKRVLHLPNDFVDRIVIRTEKRTVVYIDGLPKGNVRVFEVGGSISSVDDLPR